MSLQEKMRGWQKAVWMLLIGALLVVELKAISRDREESRAQAETILKKTETAANAATEGVADLTGGDAYIVIVPSFYFDKMPEMEGVIHFLVHAERRTVWDTDVTVYEKVPAKDPRMTYDQKFLAHIPLGAVSSAYMRPLGFDARPPKDQTTTYFFEIFARNRATHEAIDVRYNAQSNHWEFRTRVGRGAETGKSYESLVDTDWTH